MKKDVLKEIQIDPKNFESINDLQNLCHKLAKKKGWWVKPREDGTCLMNIVSEIAEANEALRETDIETGALKQSTKIPDFYEVEEELADTIIRILDFAGKHEFRIGEAMKAKLEFNQTRSYRHGKKY
jgi:NTP pyrophosphatase (non-canonical NTP hydrolase)